MVANDAMLTRDKSSKRKRSSVDNKDGNDENRKRGRPRVDPQNESAADVGHTLGFAIPPTMKSKISGFLSHEHRANRSASAVARKSGWLNVHTGRGRSRL